MKKTLIYCFYALIISCEPVVKEFDNSLLNGYWEIASVQFPDGTSKPYKVSTSIDYIEIAQDQGYLKKMNPGLNGRYTTTNSTAYFKLIKKNTAWFMQFEEPVKQFHEIITLDSLHYTIKNKQNIQYLYKRYFPIDLSNE